MLKEHIVDTQVKKYFKQIVEILEKQFGECNVKVYLYGSRSRNDAYYTSDIDLAVQSNNSIGRNIIRVKDAFFESTIPYKIDVVNLGTVNDEFKKNIMNEGILIWEN